jgi:hypothetical protein
VTVYAHLVEGDSATDRLERVAQLARTSRRPVIVFAETNESSYTPLDWLLGPGCTCCLPAQHPRLRLIKAATQPGPVRFIIDAGLPALADRIAAILGTLPVRIDLNIIGCRVGLKCGIGKSTKSMGRLCH